MSQTLEVKAKGLYTHPNPIGSDIPQGALLVANNVVIDREGTTETRRGFKQFGSVVTLGASQLINKMYEYQGRLLKHYHNKLSYDSTGAGVWADYSGTYTPPTGAIRIRSVQANKNFYFATSVGVKKLDALTATVGSAGGIKALDGTGALTGATGFLADQAQVAYRIIWGIKDANGNKIIGAPSQRLIVGNNVGGAATRDVALTVTIPAGITTTHFYQVYRSGQTASLSEEPNDELQLIVEKSPSGGEIAAGSFSYTDSTPDNLRGATIYTAPSQQGILQANEPPPLCTDMAVFKNSVLYANTISKHRLNMTLISVGGSAGIVNNDTITIAGTVYTGKTAGETPASGFFQVFTGGTAAENIDDTARSLVHVINLYASNTLVYAYYLTGFSDLPGQILIEERGIGGSAFVAISSRGGAFSPPLPSSGSTYISDNETKPNRVYIAKAGQPEAVPLLNYLDIGSADKDILRIIALRDSTFVLKEDGIFRITGETFTDFRVSLFDNTTILRGIETAVSFNNQVFAYADQGVVAISDSGVAIMSRPIEQTLLQLSSSQYTNFNTASFGIPYESDRKYIFFTVTATSDTYATQAWVYNSVTNTWTRWILSMSCGIVFSVDNKLYLGSANPLSKYVYQERKNYTITDYAEEEIALTISSNADEIVTVNSTTGVAEGDQLVQFNSGGSVIHESKVVTVVDATHLEVEDDIDWEVGAAIIYKPIPVEMQWAPIHGGNPSVMKHWSDLVMLFSDVNFDLLVLEITSDVSNSTSEVPVMPKVNGPWGLFPWSSVAWGGSELSLQPIRTYIPIEKSRCNWLNVSINHSQALSSFANTGIALFYEEQGPRRK